MPQVFRHAVQVKAFQNIVEGLGAHIGAEDLAPALFEFTVTGFGQELQNAQILQSVQL